MSSLESTSSNIESDEKFFAETKQSLETEKQEQQQHNQTPRENENNDVEELKKHIDHLNRTLESREDELIKSVEIGQQLLQKNKELSEKNNQHSDNTVTSEEIDEKNNTIVRLENTIRDLETENAALLNTFSKLRSERNELQTKSSVLSEELEQAKEELRQKEKELQSDERLRNRVKGLLEEVDKYRSELEQYHSMQRMQQQKQQQQQQNQNQNQENEKQEKEEIKTIQESEESENHEWSSSEYQDDNISEQKRQNIAINELESKNSTLRERVEEMQRKLTVAEEDRQELEEKIKMLTTENNTLKHTLQSDRQVLNRTRKRINSLENNNLNTSNSSEPDSPSHKKSILSEIQEELKGQGSRGASPGQERSSTAHLAQRVREVMELHNRLVNTTLKSLNPTYGSKMSVNELSHLSRRLIDEIVEEAKLISVEFKDELGTETFELSVLTALIDLLIDNADLRKTNNDISLQLISSTETKEKSFKKYLRIGTPKSKPLPRSPAAAPGPNEQNFENNSKHKNTSFK